MNFTLPDTFNHDPPDVLDASLTLARLNSFFTCSERLGRPRLKQAQQLRVPTIPKIPKIAQNPDFPAKPGFPGFPRRFSAAARFAHRFVPADSTLTSKKTNRTEKNLHRLVESYAEPVILTKIQLTTYMRRTKIISTLGPVTSSPEKLEALIRTGVNVFRFNMSHAPHDWVRQTAVNARAAAARVGHEVALLLDTQGPAIRTEPSDGVIDLKVGDRISFTVKGQKGTEPISVGVNYPDLVDDIVVGQEVIVDNGNLRMRAIERRENESVCEVLTPGPLGSRRHINLPGVHVKLPALTEKDWKDIELAFECKFDYIAMSFVREAHDLDELRAKIKKHDSHIKIVSKIEDQIAVKNLEQIIAATDALMIARGDLGIEVPYEELPIIQRRAINLCLNSGKMVIVATHMLESMIVNPSPTRAEITDIANAVFEHADAIMLSGETTTGKYPLECVEIMDRIAKRIELSKTVAEYHCPRQAEEPVQKVLASAVHLANAIKAKGICVFTHSGMTASFIASLRPQVSPIFAFTPNEETARRLSLTFGVGAEVLEFNTDPNVTLKTMEKSLQAHRHAVSGDTLVVISDIIVGETTIHAVFLHTVK